MIVLMLFPVNRDIESFFSALNEFECLQYLIYDCPTIFYHDVEDQFPRFQAGFADYSVFEVYLCLRALRRLPQADKLTPHLERKIIKILENGKLMRELPLVEEAAAYFYDSFPGQKPDDDYKLPFYYGDDELSALLTYDEFSNKVDFLHERVFVGCDDFAVIYSM